MNDGTATAVDGRTVSFAYQPGGALTVTTEQGGQDVYAAGPGFTISAHDLPFDSYFATTYSMNVDRQGFYQEAADKGLLDGAGNAMGTDRAPQLTVKNQVAGDRGQNANASAGQVKVESATFGKSVKDVDASAGSATWRLSAKTSDSLDADGDYLLSAVWGWRQSPDACAGSDGSVLSHKKSMQRARA